MLIIAGGDALPAPRAAKILQEMQARRRGCIAVDARFLHFADTAGKLESAQRAKLRELLRYGPGSARRARAAADDEIIVRVVTPRLGTISAWSSKATEILHRCGLRMVRRVERGVEWQLTFRAAHDIAAAADTDTDAIAPLIHDPMTESVLRTRRAAAALFRRKAAPPPAVIDLLGGGLAALEAADAQFGFALSDAERRYLLAQFMRLGRNPSDVELMMFAQVNSEHCRHKIFNADWRMDGRAMRHSLFDMIRETERRHGGGTLLAYDDNAAVLAGFAAERLQAGAAARAFTYRREAAHFTAKVETHNHPTAISPHPGAATGAGGEIRDAAATGRGGKPKAGIVGYTVSHLRLPGLPRPWEKRECRPARIASPLRIMLQAPLGAAAFNNEFGRPCIAGYFRTFEQTHGGVLFGYHKPIMLAGGIGGIRPQHLRKRAIPNGALLIALGGPVMLIGLGGGAASSIESGGNREALDFASVQRANAEMQRRCQEVIDACIALGADNPILSIHDVGAGGLSNALPELVRASGGEFELRDVPSADSGMTPLEVWCNESQERYVLALPPARWDAFEKICRRERCPAARIGRATAARQLVVRDRDFAASGAAAPVDLPMEVLFASPPKMRRDAMSAGIARKPLRIKRMPLARAAKLVLGFPAVADKSFLVTICDRSVTGLVAREPMVGRWQVPVADAGVTASGYRAVTGEAIALGERTPLALLDAAASARMAAGEALTNIACARIGGLGDIKFSANWMAAAGEPGQDAALYRAVQSLARLCAQLGISIPVGKDSMSMRVSWRERGRARKAVSPLSPLVTAFAKVEDIGETLTPELARDADNELWLLDLGRGKNRLGGSALAQVCAQLGDAPPDVDDAKYLRRFFDCVQALSRRGLLLAYHDRSDGGLLACACEMAFAARCELELDLTGLPGAPAAVLFNEELGAVLQTRASQRALVEAEMRRHGLRKCAHRIGRAAAGDDIIIGAGGARWLHIARVELHRAWSETGWRMQSLRDNPECAAQEYARIADTADPGLFSRAAFDHRISPVPAPRLLHHRPKIAILREQGVNGQLEMAAAFDCAGFEAVDVAMSDLAHGESLANYRGFAACGGFSFGDVLGAGEGWAKSILHNPRLRDMFAEFFQRGDTFALGVCNGCQMMAAAKELVPGAAHWPRFARNRSERFEARTLMVEITSERSVLLRGMQGAMLPVASAHGEGRAEWRGAARVCLRFVDHYGAPAEGYPANPNGSPGGATGFTNDDGRFTIMMPHPERVLRAVCNAWRPAASGADDWGEYAPWIRLFQNARAWVG